MRRTLPLTLLVGATWTIACTDVASDPEAAASIAFDTLPAPSVVAGDTMRDTTGAAASLRAQVFNGRGDLLPDAPVIFIATTRGAALRTVNDVLPQGYVIARPDTFADQVQVLAQVQGLQSVPRGLDIVPAPVALRAAGPTALELAYRADVDTSSSPLRVKVGYDSAGAFKGVKSWLVRFAIVYPQVAADTGAPVFLVADSTSLRRDRSDTTGSDGVASRAVRIRPAKLAAGGVDSVVVEARATYKAPLVGSPVRFVVRYNPRP
jgi:hypothetical protein